MSNGMYSYMLTFNLCFFQVALGCSKGFLSAEGHFDLQQQSPMFITGLFRTLSSGTFPLWFGSV